MNQGTSLMVIDQILSLLIGGLFLAVCIFVGWQLYKRHQKRKEAEPEGVEQKEAEPIIQNIRLLNRTLKKAQEDERQASIHLTDARTYTQNLVNLIQAIVLKAESMAREIESLQDCLEAIDCQDPIGIAKAAGSVKDEHVRTLMLCSAKDLNYWHQVAKVVATQVGTLAQWQRGYRAFSENLLTEVSKSKALITAEAAKLELTGTAAPLLQAQANLRQAQKFLKLGSNPGLYEAAKVLPPVSAGLLDRGQ